jgi:hypothetical protein
VSKLVDQIIGFVTWPAVSVEDLVRTPLEVDKNERMYLAVGSAKVRFMCVHVGASEGHLLRTEQ